MRAHRSKPSRLAALPGMVGLALSCAFPFHASVVLAGPNCKDGKVAGPDTSGHCCWEGQAWNGSACVGAPSKCPDGRVVGPGKDSCELAACDAGKSRMPDGVHCCWPKQAWSNSRSSCLGTPDCPAGLTPKGETCVSEDMDGDGIPNSKDECKADPEDKDGFQDEDGCPDPDNDHDGIPDKTDKCPNEPEDNNGHNDTDGCPDEPERLVVVADARKAQEAKAAQEAERKRQEDQRREQLSARQAADEERERQARLEESRKSRASWRTVGYVSMGVGGALLAGSGICALLSKATNDNIQNGGFSSGGAIEDEANRGQTYNKVSYVLAGAGGFALLFGGISVLASPDPGGPPRPEDPSSPSKQAKRNLHVGFGPGSAVLFGQF